MMFRSFSPLAALLLTAASALLPLIASPANAGSWEQVLPDSEFRGIEVRCGRAIAYGRSGQESTVRAYAIRDGQLQWEHTVRPYGLFNIARHLQANCGKVFVSGSIQTRVVSPNGSAPLDTFLRGLSATTGAVLWEVVNAPGYRLFPSDLVLGSGLLFFRRSDSLDTEHGVTEIRSVATGHVQDELIGPSRDLDVRRGLLLTSTEGDRSLPVAAFDAHTLLPVWTEPAPQGWLRETATSRSHLIAMRTLGEDDDQKRIQLRALNLLTGSVSWERTLAFANQGNTTPQISAKGDLLVVVDEGSGSLQAYSASTGEIRWTAEPIGRSKFMTAGTNGSRVVVAEDSPGPERRRLVLRTHDGATGAVLATDVAGFRGFVTQLAVSGRRAFAIGGRPNSNDAFIRSIAVP